MRLLLLLLTLSLPALGQTHVFRGDSPLYTDFVDREFPFLEATVDFRGIAPEGTSDNLVPRALVLPLSHDIYVCFDTELLRVAGIWQGDFTTMEGLALLSYEVPLRKKGGGQKSLPKPKGEVFASTGLYPGWQLHERKSLDDPRPRGLDEKELGRGPLPADQGEWLGVEDAGETAILRYTVSGARISEVFSVTEIDGTLAVVRSIQVEDGDENFALILVDAGASQEGQKRLTTRQCASGDSRFSIMYPINGGAYESTEPTAAEIFETKKTRPHWPNPAITEFELGAPQGAYAVDELRIPYPNPWGRRIRPYGIEFFPNGDAAVVTFDGDVYRLSNLGTNDDAVEWRRVAAGFNEPASIRIREDSLYVFSRLGITRLVDRDGDGETDFYQMFSNRFTQSAETRDFAHSLTNWKDGSWIISKGGQQNDHRSPHSGRVLKISPDGKDVTYWAYGLRNGFVNSMNGNDFLVASDQQGHWVPTTPFHIVRKDSYMGFELGAPSSPKKIQPAALLFPHRIAQSGIDTMWGSDPRLGPMNDAVLYIEYKKPSLLKILVPEKGNTIQASGLQLEVEFQTPILKGALNPADGLPYMVGFQIWDSLANRLEGLCRIRPIREHDGSPISASVFKEGVLLRFNESLSEEAALDPASYQVSSWNYLRQSSYGSAQYKADGSPGIDTRFVHSTQLSEDRKAVFIAIDEMTTAMQLEVQHYLFGAWKQVYFTIHELPRFTAKKHGFPSTNFKSLFASEPTPRDTTTKEAIVSGARGQELSILYGCIGCHSVDGSTEGKSGPTWKGVYNSRRELSDGKSVRAREEYLRESILEPTATMLKGFDATEAGMPSYKGILSDEDLESLVLFIRSLR